MSFAFVAPLAKGFLSSVATNIVKSKLGGGTKSKTPTIKTQAIKSVKSISDMQASRTSPTVASATLNIAKQIATQSMFGQKSNITRSL
jgi:CheY-specific phosphatase CheX